MANWVEKLKKRWGVRSALQVFVILIVFALTGFTAMYIKKPIFRWLGVDATMPFYLRTIIYIFTVLPAYQIFLLFYGFLLGQFRFFWLFEKRMAQRIIKPFVRNKPVSKINR